MKIVQLNPTKENIWEMLVRDDVYVVRFCESRAKRSEGRREITPYPSGLSFKHVGRMTVQDLVESICNNKMAVVQLVLEEP